MLLTGRPYTRRDRSHLLIHNQQISTATSKRMRQFSMIFPCYHLAVFPLTPSRVIPDGEAAIASCCSMLPLGNILSSTGRGSSRLLRSTSASMAFCLPPALFGYSSPLLSYFFKPCPFDPLPFGYPPPADDILLYLLTSTTVELPILSTYLTYLCD